MLAELRYVAFGWQIAGASPDVVNPLFILTILGPLVQGPAGRDCAGGHRHRQQTIDRASSVARHRRIHCRAVADLRRPGLRPDPLLAHTGRGADLLISDGSYLVGKSSAEGLVDYRV
jgi:hypothetical protein